MHNVRQINDDYYYIGCNDRRIALFESTYRVEDGVSYNSYFLDDEKTVLFDTVDKAFCGQFFENLKFVLGGRNLDYFVINHIEPDHSALLKCVIEKYPNVKIVCNQKLKQMLFQFFEFDFDIENNFHIVKENDTLSTGRHNFTFIMAPMVHWPEVMVSYDSVDKILFSADAFGSFGALSGNLFDDETEINIDEYRRYYTNIVGKYGTQVNALLNKAKNIDIKMVCPLHGLVLKKQIPNLVEKYSLWASYNPEIKSALVVYSSVYGGTQNAADIVSSKLAQNGVKNIKTFDISHSDSSRVLSEAFKYSHIVLATTTYNMEIFTSMDNFISNLVKHNLQNRTYAIIENGSWACNCGKLLKEKLEKLKNSKIIENEITLQSSVKTSQSSEFDELAKILAKDILG